MIVRPMVDGDLGHVLELENASFKQPWTPDHFHRELHENPYALLFVAEQEGTFLGFIDVWIMFEQATINQIAVVGDYRGKGIGSIMLEDACNRVKTAGAHQISLEVRVTNQSAYEFYLKHGFKFVLRKPHYYQDGEDANFMVKQL
jgi:ribosomal-protein-alanine N-acetyltransferase